VLAAVAVNVTNIKPLAQLLTQNGSALLGAEGGAALLFQPVIQVNHRCYRLQRLLSSSSCQEQPVQKPHSSFR
jgi:hypothetical protein